MAGRLRTQPRLDYQEDDDAAARVLWPTAEKRELMTEFKWSHINVQKVRGGQRRGQRGVFASEDLKPNDFFPHLGLECLTGKDPIELRLTHALDVSTKSDTTLGFTRFLNGDLPWTADSAHVSSWGACITMMINEPGLYTLPNCVLKKEGVLVTQPITKGTELLVLYNSAGYHQFADEQAYIRTGEHWITNEINAMWRATSKDPELQTTIDRILNACDRSDDQRKILMPYEIIDKSTCTIPKSRTFDMTREKFQAKIVENLKNMTTEGVQGKYLAHIDSVFYHFDSSCDDDGIAWYWSDSEAVLTQTDYWYDEKFNNADCFKDAEPILSPEVRCAVHTSLRDGKSIGDGLFLKNEVFTKEPLALTRMIFPVKSNDLDRFKALIETTLGFPHDSKFDSQRYSTFDLYFVFNKTPLWYTMNCSTVKAEDNVTIKQGTYEWRIKNNTHFAKDSELLYSYNKEKNRDWGTNETTPPSQKALTVKLITLDNIELRTETMMLDPALSTAEQVARIKIELKVPVRVIHIDETEATVTFWPKFRHKGSLADSSPELSLDSERGQKGETIGDIVIEDNSQPFDEKVIGLTDREVIQHRCAEILAKVQFDATARQALPNISTGMSNGEATDVIFVLDSESEHRRALTQDEVIVILDSDDEESAFFMSQNSQGTNSGDIIMLLYKVCPVCGLSPL